MQITTELGQEIISRLQEYIDVDINIMDLTGKIVASTDKGRISQLHIGAAEVIKSGEDLIIRDNNIQAYPGTKTGVNLPITHRYKMAGVVGVSGNPDDIMRITGLIRVSVEMVIDQIYIQQQAHYTERQWNNWLHQLLHPSGYDAEKLDEESVYSLQVDTSSFWRIMVLIGSEAHDHLNNIRSEISSSKINTLFTLPFSENEIIIALAMDFPAIKRLAERLSQLGFQIGVGSDLYGLEGIRTSYQQAEQAIWLNNGKHTVTFAENWKIERMTSSIPADVFHDICIDFKQRLETLGEDYIETVDVYFAMNFSVKETANTLLIHRNTLLYRLDQIKHKVGLDPRDFHDAFLLKVIRSRKEI